MTDILWPDERIEKLFTSGFIHFEGADRDFLYKMRDEYQIELNQWRQRALWAEAQFDKQKDAHAPRQGMTEGVRKTLLASVVFAASHAHEIYGDDQWVDGLFQADAAKEWLAHPTPAPPTQPVALDAPDGDGEFWFDGEATYSTRYRTRTIRLQDAVSVWSGRVFAGRKIYPVENMRGKWYKRDVAPWSAQEGQGDE